MIKILNLIYTMIKMLIQLLKLHVFFRPFQYDGTNCLHLDLLNKNNQNLIDNKTNEIDGIDGIDGAISTLLSNEYFIYGVVFVASAIIIGVAVYLYLNYGNSDGDGSSDSSSVISDVKSEIASPDLIEKVQDSAAEIVNTQKEEILNAILKKVNDLIMPYNETEGFIDFLHNSVENLTFSGLKVNAELTEFMPSMLSDELQSMAEQSIPEDVLFPIFYTFLLMNSCRYITDIVGVSVPIFIEAFQPLFAANYETPINYCPNRCWERIIAISVESSINYYRIAENQILVDKNFLILYEEMLKVLHQ